MNLLVTAACPKSLRCPRHQNGPSREGACYLTLSPGPEPCTASRSRHGARLVGPATGTARLETTGRGWSECVCFRRAAGRLSIHLSVHPPTHPLIRPSVHPLTHLSIHSSICPPAHPSIYTSICLSITHPFACLSICPSIHSSLHPPTHPYIFLSMCPSVHPSIRDRRASIHSSFNPPSTPPCVVHPSISVPFRLDSRSPDLTHDLYEIWHPLCALRTPQICPHRSATALPLSLHSCHFVAPHTYPRPFAPSVPSQDTGSPRTWIQGEQGT
jgi:hypothetical protein